LRRGIIHADNDACYAYWVAEVRRRPQLVEKILK